MGEHKNKPWEDKCTWNACGKCKPCRPEEFCENVCAEYRNGAKADDGLGKCVGPKESFGRPCYPQKTEQGSKIICDSDWKKCPPKITLNEKPLPPPRRNVTESVEKDRGMGGEN